MATTIVEWIIYEQDYIHSRPMAWKTWRHQTNEEDEGKWAGPVYRNGFSRCEFLYKGKSKYVSPSMFFVCVLQNKTIKNIYEKQFRIMEDTRSSRYKITLIYKYHELYRRNLRKSFGFSGKIQQNKSDPQIVIRCDHHCVKMNTLLNTFT